LAASRSLITDPLLDLLQNVSAELVAIDKAAIRAASGLFRRGTEIFIANLPKHKTAMQLEAAIALRQSGMTPVPHLVARNMESAAEFAALMRGLSEQAGVNSALVLGGDRDLPLGPYQDSLQLLNSGHFERYGFKKIYIAGYPEGHRHISDAALALARSQKLAAAAARGLEVTLLSQFCFDSQPIIKWVRGLRAAGVTAPYRVGVAGPASKAALIKFAMLCGVGPSLRALQSREQMASNLLRGETPEGLLRDVARARKEMASLNIDGAHFYTFGTLSKVSEWLNTMDPSGHLTRTP
jgi:methylenetetrahydrofolate reductase (NADPH)